MAVGICVPLPSQEDLERLRARLPGLGEFYKFRETLRGLPDLSQYTLNFLGLLSVHLGFLQPLITIVELLAAILNCFLSVIRAVSRLSPGPIFSCIDNLRELLERLLEYVPPIPYLRALADISAAIIILIDQAMYVLMDLESQVVRAFSLAARGLQLGDAQLSLLADCAKDEAVEMAVNLVTALGVIGRLGAIVVMVAALLTGGAGNALDALDAARTTASQMASQIRSAGRTATIPFAALVTLLNVLRQVFYAIHSLCARPIGEYLELRPLPNFVPRI